MSDWLTKIIVGIGLAQIGSIGWLLTTIGISLTRPLAIRGIVGIGATTAAALLALMPELGTLTRRQAAALSGLAPHPRKSGATDAYRRTRGGRPEVKRVLLMSAMVAARHDPTLRASYQRLLTNGKKPMVALVALMRKLVVICNAVLRQHAVPRHPMLVAKSSCSSELMVRVGVSYAGTCETVVPNVAR